MDRKKYESLSNVNKINPDQIEMSNNRNNYPRHEEFKDDKSEISNRLDDQSINSRRPLNNPSNISNNISNNNIHNDNGPVENINSPNISRLQANQNLNSNIFKVDLSELAEQIFKNYVKNHRKVKSEYIDNYEIKNLLDVIGIKKNEFEITAAINKVRMERAKAFENEELGYTVGNFQDVVQTLKDYRIDDKLLIKAFQTIDREGDGLINAAKIKNISSNLQLGLSDEEINDMLGYFDIENIVNNEANENMRNNYEMDFELFSKLYYQG